MGLFYWFRYKRLELRDWLYWRRLARLEAAVLRRR
jgi:hypothetical protein